LAVGAGAFAVGANLLLNHAVSGTSYRPVYETILDRDHNVDSAGSFGILLRLWFPMGVPHARDVLRFVHRYWIEMEQLKWLLFAQLALIPMFLGIGWRARGLWALALLVMLLILISHTDPGVFGNNHPKPLLYHSLPRYWSPLYLFAALPPLIFLGRTRFRSVVAVGAVLAGLLAWSTLDGIFRKQTTPFIELHQQVARGPALLDRLSAVIPDNAIVYSSSWHGTLWSRFRTGLIDTTGSNLQPTADSMNRVVRAGIPVYVYTVRANVIRRRLDKALAKYKLKMVEVDRRLHVYRVQRTGRKR